MIKISLCNGKQKHYFNFECATSSVEVVVQIGFAANIRTFEIYNINLQSYKICDVDAIEYGSELDCSYCNWIRLNQVSKKTFIDFPNHHFHSSISHSLTNHL